MRRLLLTAAAGLALTLVPAATAATAGSTASTQGAQGRASHPRSSSPTPPPVPSPGWSRTVAVTRPAAVDIPSPVPAVSLAGELAIGGGTTNEDAQATAAASLTEATLLAGRSAAAGPRFAAPHELAGTQQVLAGAFAGTRLVLVTGTSPPRSGLACCTSAAIVGEPVKHGRATSRTLTAALTGPAQAELVPITGGLVAVVSAQTGIWLARIGDDGRARAVSKLAGSAGALVPASVAAARLSSGGAIVAWATPVPYALAGTTGEVVRFAVSGPRGLPVVAQTAIVLPVGDTVGSIAVAAHRGTATILLTQTQNAALRGTVAEVLDVDVGPHGSAVRRMSPDSSFATAVSLASGPDGRQVASWQQCAPQGTSCTAEVDVRPHGNAWTAPQRLGAIDPQAYPVLGVESAGSAAGAAVVAWVLRGDLLARTASPHARSFGQTHTLSATGSAQEPSITFGPAGTALAAWVDGAAIEQVRAATSTAG